MLMKRRIFFGMTVALLGLIFGALSIDSTRAADIWHYWLSGGEKEAIDALVKGAKEAYPNDTFTLDGIPGATVQLRQQLGAAFLAKKPPEMYQSAIGYDLKSYVDAKQLAPIDDIWKSVNGNEIFPKGLQSMVHFQGHAWAIPLNMHIISHIFYNKHIFDKYGLKPPTNWEEYNKISEILRSNGIEPMAGARDWAVYPFYAPLVTVLGPEGYMDLGNGKIPFTDQRVRKAFVLFKDTIIKSYMKGWAGYGWAEAANPFFEGKVAMYLNGDWVVSLFQQRGWTPGVDFDFFPAPGMQNIDIMQVDALAVPKGSADAKGTKDFLTYAASVDGQKAFNQYKGSVAANLNVEPSIYNATIKKTYDRIQQLSKNGVILPNITYCMFPPELGAEFLHQTERYALSPDTRTLNSVLNTLESMRKRLAKAGKFANWSYIK
jgi:glucose/mannose transport system substrate-binding protein